MSVSLRSYAQAFLGAAPPGYDVDGFLERAQAVVRAIAREPRLRSFFASPAVPAPAKAKALDALARKADLDDFGRRFFDLLLRKRRLLQLPQILTGLREEADRQNGVVEAHVRLASVPAPEDLVSLRGALERASGRRVRMETSIDPGILGGFVARVGSELFDASVSRAVEQFERKMGRSGSE